MCTYSKKDSKPKEASFGWTKCCTSMQQQKGFLLSWRWRIQRVCKFHKRANVRSGNFPVVTAENGEKFFVDLRYLNHPQFLRLLDAAEEVFGLNQTGVLVLPCEASELQRILLTKYI